MTPWFQRLIAISFVCFLTVGCGVSPSSRSVTVAAPVVSTVHASGRVRGGQQPIVGSAVYLYAVSTADGGTATSLLKGTGFVLTGLDGSFTITSDYTCPAGAYVYLLAKGGNPGVGVDNPEIALGAGLGQCSSLTASTYFELNEVTTVAMAYSLAAYATSETQIGTTENLSAAFANIAALVEPTAGMALGGNQTIATPRVKLNSLADSIAACINSTGVGMPCSTLMSAAGVTGSGGTPVDTFQAVLNIAKDPTANVSEIYGLKTASAPFEPMLSMAPSDWTIAPANVSGCIVADANTYVFRSSQGDIAIELRPDAAPKNVANLLTYINSGAYNNSIIHRVQAGFVNQGGGYYFNSGGSLQDIPANAPVVNEANLSNLRGTMSMALTGSDLNSATNQFFFNVADNSAYLDGQDTVVGQAVEIQGVYNGYGVGGCGPTSLAVLDAINADMTFDLSSSLGPAFTTVPLEQYAGGGQLTAANFVTFSSVVPLTDTANTVATPVPDLASGSYTGTQAVTLTDTTPGAVIYYCSTNGSTECINMQGAPVQGQFTQYTNPISVAASETLFTYATAAGYVNQSVYNEGEYTIK